jgi:hypothetical protein
LNFGFKQKPILNILDMQSKAIKLDAFTWTSVVHRALSFLCVNVKRDFVNPPSLSSKLSRPRVSMGGSDHQGWIAYMKQAYALPSRLQQISVVTNVFMSVTLIMWKFSFRQEVNFLWCYLFVCYNFSSHKWGWRKETKHQLLYGSRTLIYRPTNPSDYVYLAKWLSTAYK